MSLQSFKQDKCDLICFFEKTQVPWERKVGTRRRGLLRQPPGSVGNPVWPSACHLWLCSPFRFHAWHLSLLATCAFGPAHASPSLLKPLQRLPRHHREMDTAHRVC